MIRWRLVLIGGLAGVAALAAVESGRAVLAATASQVAAPPTAAIAGRVVDGVTGRPIAGVTITVTMVSPPLVARPEWDAAARQAAAAARRRSVQTDVDGRFATDGQPSGTFLVLANGSAVGYLAGIPGQQTPRGAGRGSVTLQAGERRTDLAIKLWRGGSISGVIQDDRGEPLVKARCTCFDGSICRDNRSSPAFRRGRTIAGSSGVPGSSLATTSSRSGDAARRLPDPKPGISARSTTADRGRR
jgi:hypothetical protein